MSSSSITTYSPRINRNPSSAIISTTSSGTIIFSPGLTYRACSLVWIYIDQFLISRFSDQVEFKLPKKYDDGFTRVDADDGSEDTDDNKSTITTSVPPSLSSQGKTNRSSPVKKLHKMSRKQVENSPTNETPEKNILSEHSMESRSKVATQGD